MESIGDSIDMEPCCGTQVYESFTDLDQKESDSLHKPVPNVSSEAIVSGQAEYVDDIPKMAGNYSELHCIGSTEKSLSGSNILMKMYNMRK